MVWSYGASMAELSKGFVVAGPASGVGKTTVALALMSALRRRGLTVQPFKCGPDFIDGGHHARVCVRPVRNLDGWMLTPDANREIFYRAATNADVCVIEGVMGLFDGVDGASETGSTAEIAKLLRLPVVLVVDASSAARSVAALVHGFETFDPDLKLAGVIFNKVAGEAHYRLLRDALVNRCSATLLGCLPRDERIQIPERYLGLFTAGENLLPESALALLGELAENNIDLEKLLGCACSLRFPVDQTDSISGAAVRVGIARDRAFCFYYEDNLDALKAAGAEILQFSPLDDPCLPEGIDALYLGGGYPELWAAKLAANRGMLASVKRFADRGSPVYAECGGLMYLAKEIVTRDGSAFPMAGVLPLRVQMTDRLVKFGYTEVSFTADCLIGGAGGRARGHSFHCSRILDLGPVKYAYRVRNSLTGHEEPEGLRVGNVLASYIHLHFSSAPGMAAQFVQNVERTKRAELSMTMENPCRA